MIFKLFFCRRQICIIFPLFFLLIVTSGCSDLRQAIGKEKFVPDEYSIMKTPSLVVPPGFGIDKELFNNKDDVKEEKNISFSNKNTENKEFDSLFDTSKIPENIRKLVDEETLGLGLSERTGIDILFGQIPETGVVLDSEKESLRIRKNIDEKKSLLSDPSPSTNKVDGSNMEVN